MPMRVLNHGMRRKAAALVLLSMANPGICLTDHALGKELPDAVVAPAPVAVPNQQTQSLDDLVTALGKGSPYERQRAAIALGNMKNAQAVDPLIQSLKDEDDFVRDFSARSLGNIGDARAVKPLIQALSDRNAIVRYASARALGRLKNPEAVNSLVNALESEDTLLQRTAAEALSEIGDAKAIDSLIQALRDEDIYVRTGVSNAIVRIGEPAIPRLVAALGVTGVSSKAAELLKELRWQPSSEEEKKSFAAALENKTSGI